MLDSLYASGTIDRAKYKEMSEPIQKEIRELEAALKHREAA
jgi:hypothetical protein